MTQSNPNTNVGILSRQDIEEAIDNNIIIKDASKSSLQACSYDMRIGTIFKDGQIINNSHADANHQISVKPGEIISVFTWEELDLPSNIMATVFAINELSSKGLLVLNPGHIDPGFKGCLSVKAVNLRKAPLTISRGTKIFTIVFQILPKSTTTPYDKYIPREERERDFNARDVEVATRNLSELVILGKDSPYPDRREVKEIVQKHWMTWLTLILTLIAALAGVLSVVLTIVNSKPDIINPQQSTPNIANPKSSNTQNPIK